jgi:hypothetical protein
MADFEHHGQTAAKIALEIERKLAILGLDWRDAATMRRLAREVMEPGKPTTFAGFEQGIPSQLAYMELQGLINLMLRTMEEGAEGGEVIHGSDAWKALARALWNEHEGDGSSVPRET